MKKKQKRYLFLLPAFLLLTILGRVLYYQLDWSVLADLSFYLDMANPSMRIVKIKPGMRQEEVVETIGTKLGWTQEEKTQFQNAHIAFGKTSLEGYYFPKSYVIHKDEDPIQVTQTILDEFQKQTKNIKKSKTTSIVNEDTALKIASLIEREAAGKHDMKLISGIIWNRIFAGMRLQIDATLQYAKGNEEDGWWQIVEPEDKKIDSAYNTYKYNTLPPTPIASPSLAAIEAAYNPQKTSCMYYIHDKRRRIHCAATYEEHKKNIDKYY